MESITSFFSSLMPVVHNDAEEKQEEPSTEAAAESTEQPAAEEEEEEEPEDPLPEIREECKESAACASLAKHFEHCQEKVQAGNGFKGEDCVEELMMHCVDACAAPKLFSKVK